MVSDTDEHRQTVPLSVKIVFSGYVHTLFSDMSSTPRNCVNWARTLSGVCRLHTKNAAGDYTGQGRSQRQEHFWNIQEREGAWVGSRADTFSRNVTAETCFSLTVIDMNRAENQTCVSLQLHNICKWYTVQVLSSVIVHVDDGFLWLF